MYECIDVALAERRALGLYLKAHPNWDPYRDDPRFTALLRRMGWRSSAATRRRWNSAPPVPSPPYRR
jgi:hypothetical protein